jgi:hypothetical protein
LRNVLFSNAKFYIFNALCFQKHYDGLQWHDGDAFIIQLTQTKLGIFDLASFGWTYVEIRQVLLQSKQFNIILVLSLKIRMIVCWTNKICGQYLINRVPATVMLYFTKQFKSVFRYSCWGLTIYS